MEEKFFSFLFLHKYFYNSNFLFFSHFCIFYFFWKVKSFIGTLIVMSKVLLMLLNNTFKYFLFLLFICFCFAFCIWFLTLKVFFFLKWHLSFIFSVIISINFLIPNINFLALHQFYYLKKWVILCSNFRNWILNSALLFNAEFICGCHCVQFHLVLNGFYFPLFIFYIFVNWNFISSLISVI